MSQQTFNPFPLSDKDIKLNTELGLVMPQNISPDSNLTEFKRWFEFFALMRRAYLQSMLTKEQVNEHYTLFGRIPTENKHEVNLKLERKISEKEHEMFVYNIIQKKEENLSKLDEFIQTLDENEQQILFQLVARGRSEPIVEVLGLPLEEIKQIFGEDTNQLVLDRLSAVLNKGYNLRAKDLTGNESEEGNKIVGYGKVLQPEELQERFSSQKVEKTTKPISSPQPTDQTPIRNNSNQRQTQPEQTPQQRLQPKRTVIAPKRNKPQQFAIPKPAQPPQNQSSPQFTKKISNLDDLLNPKQ